MPPAPSRALLRAPGLTALPWLRHGFGTRACGLASPAPEPWLRRGGGPAAVLMLRQVHGDGVWRDPEPGRAGDGLMSDREGVWLGIRTADCCPVLVADVRQRAVGAVHAGWRGTAARIAEKAVGEMRAAFGTRPEDVRAAIGPCIGACCYEVGEEVVEAMAPRFADSERWMTAAEPDWLAVRYPNLFLTASPPGHLPETPRRRLDLAAALAAQLEAAGVAAEHIERVGGCTACQADFFYSHRARRETGRMVSAIGVVV